MSLCDGHGPDWLEDYKIFYYFWLWLGSGSHLAPHTKQLERELLYRHWLVILFQERDRSPAPGRDATRSLPDLTSWPDISELTRARRTLSAPCVTRDSWDQITWGKLSTKWDLPSLPHPLYKLSSVLSFVSKDLPGVTIWRPQYWHTDTPTSGW